MKKSSWEKHVGNRHTRSMSESGISAPSSYEPKGMTLT